MRRSPWGHSVAALVGCALACGCDGAPFSIDGGDGGAAVDAEDPADAPGTDAPGTDAAPLDARAPDDAPIPRDAPFLPGDVCATAEPIAEGMITSLSIDGYANDVLDVPDCAATGPDRFFTIVVPAGRQLVVRSTRETAGTWLPWPVMFEDCPGASSLCVEAASVLGPGMVEALYANGTTADRTIVIMVDAGAPATGTFSLEIFLRDPPSGDACGTAVAITPGTLTGTLAGFSNDLRSGADDCVASLGPDAFYAIDVPAGSVLTATATPMDPGGTSIALLRDCTAPLACLASADTGATDAPDTVRWLNGGAAAATILVAVDSTYSGAGRFTLTTSVAPRGVSPGETCASPDGLGFGTRAGDSTLGYTNDHTAGGTGCAYGAGPDRAYAVRVTGASRLDVTVTPDPGLDVSLSIVDGTSACASGTCVAGVDTAGAGGVETAFANNATTTFRTWIVIVDGAGASDVGRYSITATVGPL
jgi:hypothetical protein